MSKSIGKNLRKSSSTCLFATTPCGEIFRFWTARQARSHERTNFAAERASKLATVSPIIATFSPFCKMRRGPTLLDLRAQAILWRRRVCCRIGRMLRTHRLLGDHTKGTDGSNSTRSAIQFGLQRNAAAFIQNLREIAAILRFPL